MPHILYYWHMIKYILSFLTACWLSWGMSAHAQVTCSSGLAPVNIMSSSPQGRYNYENTTTLIFTTVTLASPSQYARDGDNLEIAFRPGWSNGVPEDASPGVTMTIVVNGTGYYRITTPTGSSTVATGTAINGASTSPASPNSITRTGAPYSTQTITLSLPAAVTQIFSVAHTFASTTTPNTDDGGYSIVSVSACPIAALLSVTKTNSVTAVQAGSTTTYLVTASNGGPFAANNAIVRDTPSAGLSACTATCVSTTGGASCPVTPANLLSGSGTTLPVFPANSSVNFSVTCQVTATGT